MATQIDALASVYARSLYELAEAAGGADKIMEINDEVEQIIDLTRNDAQLHEFLGSPIIDAPKRADALRRMFDGQVTDLMLRFLLVLNNKGRLGHLAKIAAAYDQMVQHRFGRIEVDVFTAAPLDESQRSTIHARVKEALGKEPVLHAYTDEAMLGGVKLRIGDQLIDGSVAGQLRRMQESLMHSAGDQLINRFNEIIEDDNTA